MIEVEIKVAIDDALKLRELFQKNGGKYVISLNHEDTYYNMPEGLRDFRKTDEALRIRKSEAFHIEKKEPPSEARYFITYKGKKMDETTKTRQEIESKIENGAHFKEILKALGFREVFTVKKERELYNFIFQGKPIEALIDYLPILKQHFIEVEYATEDPDKIDDVKEILFEFLRTLGISKEESIRKSYLELIADKFKKKSKK